MFTFWFATTPPNYNDTREIRRLLVYMPINMQQRRWHMQLLGPILLHNNSLAPTRYGSLTVENVVTGFWSIRLPKHLQEIRRGVVACDRRLELKLDIIGPQVSSFHGLFDRLHLKLHILEFRFLSVQGLLEGCDLLLLHVLRLFSQDKEVDNRKGHLPE
nr:hypothetical protein Iba_chr04eCG18600 [Ipomoea batatas]